MKPDSFKFRLVKCKGGKILKFDLTQIAEYQQWARLDYIAVLLSQLKRANGTIFPEPKLQSAIEEWARQYNGRGLSNKTLTQHHWHRALVDYCSNSANVNALTDGAVILQLFTQFYNAI